ncbi:MAG: peptide-methionine (S)-S-oxide reductase MsrA [Anaerolineae bacterium]|nr:peptide-methionine (S)-S-oxide reductase MsrA [Anaerolineae bacterium]
MADQQAGPEAQVETATLGGGCFWCLEAVYDEMVGVRQVTSGYAGGTVPRPSYREVCSGTTGHAEVIQIVYDPRQVSYQDLLEVFFDIHDPTTLNRQGADVGTQYRSAIFYHNVAQKAIAEQMIAALEASGRWADPIVTQVVPLEAFYPAEDYHQEYYARNGRQPYCRVVIAPKLAKFRKLHLSQVKI